MKKIIGMQITEAYNKGFYVKITFSDRKIWHIVCEKYNILQLMRGARVTIHPYNVPPLILDVVYSQYITISKNNE